MGTNLIKQGENPKGQSSGLVAQLAESVLEINFFWGSKYLLPGIKGSSKTNIPSSKHWWPYYNNLVTIHWQINDQTKFHMVKGIDNAFDHMELCFVLTAAELFQ